MLHLYSLIVGIEKVLTWAWYVSGSGCSFYAKGCGSSRTELPQSSLKVDMSSAQRHFASNLTARRPNCLTRRARDHQF